jgi:hypothetical protein
MGSFNDFRKMPGQQAYINKEQSCPYALTKHHAMKAYWGVDV